MEQAIFKQKLEMRKLTNIKTVGVISDTHGYGIEKALEHFKKIKPNLIIHAGDIGNIETIKELEKIAPVIAVHGNMDKGPVRELFQPKEVIQLNNFKIGITHGYGAQLGLEERVRLKFDEKVDCIIFGHSHKPVNELINNTLFFNPGSATDTVFAQFNSIGILIVNDKIEGEIIKI